MSLLTALLTGLGGYGQGRQQAVQNKQSQEQIQQGQGYLDIAQREEKSKHDQGLRDRGIDPATLQPMQLPKNLQQVVPNNKGKAATDQQTIDHLFAVANALAAQGNTQGANIALTRAQSLETILKQQNSQLAILNREKTMADYRNQEPLNAWQQYNQGLNQQYGPPGTREPWSGGNLTAQQRWEDNYRLNHPPGGSKVTPDQAQDALVKWHNAFNKATSGNQHYEYPQNPKGQQGKQEGHAPLVTAQSISDLRMKLQQARDKGGYKGPLDPFAAIDADPDPIKLSQQLSQMTGNPTLKSLILERGRVANMQKQSQQQAQPGGVSGSTQNPTEGEQLPPVPPRAIWDLLIQGGATPQEATTLTAIALAESGGNPGAVNPTDNNGKQTSWGMFQISDGTHNEPQGWDNPVVNTQMAIAKLRSKQGLHAWGTYNSGAYRQFLPNAGVANR